MKLQNVDTARQTGGKGRSNLTIPATMIGTEQAMVIRIVKATLRSRVIAASNLDMDFIFKELYVKSRPGCRRRALILPEKHQKIGGFTLESLAFCAVPEENTGSQILSR